jgi:hypothetical protein
MDLSVQTSPQTQTLSNLDTLYRDGIVGMKGAFSHAWAEAMAAL